MIAPHTFELDDVDGHARVIAEAVPTAQHQAVSEAARSCPEQAITVTVEQLVDGRAVHRRRLEQ
jgi:ferredoxin